ncbi:MAG: FAD-dependent oxidoreductase [Planctomycetaceae bacterium]|nr:FAD-dependent oxidoreductase [Planctomycetaceae bacterium]
MRMPSLRLTTFLVAPFFLLLSLWIGTCRAEVKTEQCDLLIVGATESGWAAAIQAARMGVKRIVIVHDGVWFGGQYTEQALVCVDENKGMDNVGWGVDWHPMKRSFHRSGLFKELMDRIEAVNLEHYGSVMPGLPFHGPSTFRPAEAEAVFRAMIMPYVDSGQIQLYWNRIAVKADVNRDLPRKRIEGVWFAAQEGAEPDLHIAAPWTIDASDWGDVIQVAGVECEAGPDPPSRYGEPSAPTDFPANEMNPITWAMIVEEVEGAVAIPRPENFDDRNFPRATHVSRETFKNLHWDVPNPGQGSIPHWPAAGDEARRQLTVYSVRRIVEGEISKDGRTSILLNYMNGQDYPLERLPQRVVEALELTEPGASGKNIALMTRAQRQIVFDDAKQHSLGVLYHLQNFVHERVEDRKNSFRNFELSREFGTPDRLPPKPYIRESLRLKAQYMMREQDGRNRDGETKNSARPRFAHVMYPDGLFAWQFHYDFHRTGRTYLEEEGTSGPWIDYHKPNRHTSFISDRSLFPLRSLVPVATDGLIGSQGNVGFSSIVSAAIRLHDQRVHLGQAAGAIAAVALETGIPPHEFAYRQSCLEQVREGLCGDSTIGLPLLIWPFRDLPAEHTAFVAINRLAALGLLPLGSRDVDFHPDDLAATTWRADVLQRCGLSHLVLPADLSRGELCQACWKQISQRGFQEFEHQRNSPTDADGDGIPDLDDALLWTPNDPITFQIEIVKQPPASDGVPSLSDNDLQRFDFGSSSRKLSERFMRDAGQPYQQQRGYGWLNDLSRNIRVRNQISGPGDDFVFTRTQDTWEVDLANGSYQIVLCVGDAGHEQNQQSVNVEGEQIIDRTSTLAGMFLELETTVKVSDGRLTIQIGSGESESNTCLNWLLIRPAP